MYEDDNDNIIFIRNDNHSLKCDICNNILNTNNTKQDTREVESCDSSKGNSVVDWFLDNDSDSSSVDTSMQENELAKDIASLEISIQSLYNQTKDKRSDEVLKIYAEVDKLSPQKHELERRLAILQHKPKKNNIRHCDKNQSGFKFCTFVSFLTHLWSIDKFTRNIPISQRICQRRIFSFHIRMKKQ